jgi:nucleoside-diphosphate-sugar epimerase
MVGRMEGSLSRVAVTGAGGFIGAAVARRLAQERVDVVGLDLSSVAIWGYDFAADVDEDEDAEPRPCGVPYVDTKGASDVLARRAGATVVRPGDVYGPRSVPWAIRPLQGLLGR